MNAEDQVECDLVYSQIVNRVFQGLVPITPETAVSMLVFSHASFLVIYSYFVLVYL